jgi:flagellar biogenesis protein FliO
MRHDDFDREFERTSRLIRYGMVFSGVVTIIVLALIIAAVWAVGRFVGVW